MLSIAFGILEMIIFTEEILIASKQHFSLFLYDPILGHILIYTEQQLTTVQQG